MKLICYNKYKF